MACKKIKHVHVPELDMGQSDNKSLAMCACELQRHNCMHEYLQDK